MTRILDVETPAGSITISGCDQKQLMGWKKTYAKMACERFATREILRLPKFDVFLDIGAAFGFYSHFVKFNFPEVAVRAYECEPVRFGCLLRTTGDFVRYFGKFGNAKVYHPPLGRMVHRLEEAPAARREIACQTFDLGSELELGIGGRKILVKMDIEGAEFEVLKELHHDRPEYFSTNQFTWLIEIHEALGGGDKEEILELFEGRNIKHLHSGARGVNHTYLIS